MLAFICGRCGTTVPFHVDADLSRLPSPSALLDLIVLAHDGHRCPSTERQP